MVVCHRCDVPLCVNPAHLFIGTSGDNARDRSAKKRDADRRGTSNPNRKLTDEQITEIRDRYKRGETQVSLAKAYGVIQPHISRIVRGESWAAQSYQPPLPSRRSANNRRRRVSEEHKAEIRRRYRLGETQAYLGGEYEISQSRVSQIIRDE